MSDPLPGIGLLAFLADAGSAFRDFPLLAVGFLFIYLYQLAAPARYFAPQLLVSFRCA